MKTDRSRFTPRFEGFRRRWRSHARAPVALPALAANPPAAQRTFDTPQQAAEALVKAAEAGDMAAVDAHLRPRGQGHRLLRRCRRRQERPGEVRREGPREDERDLRRRRPEEGRPRRRRRRLAAAGADRREERKVALRREGGPRGDPRPAHRRKRARRDRAAARLRRRAEGLRHGAARRKRRSPVRAEVDQHRPASRTVCRGTTPTASRRARWATRSPRRSPRATRTRPSPTTATTSGR